MKCFNPRPKTTRYTDDLLHYCLSAFNSSKKKEVNDDQNTLFINAIDNISSYYDKLKIDFSLIIFKRLEMILLLMELAISDVNDQINSLKPKRQLKRYFCT